MESNPREQLNVITTHDKEGLVEPVPEPRQGIVDKLNTSPNQFKVGDKVLLDAADPRIATSEPNEEIPLTLIAGMKCVNSSHHLDHTEERVFPSTRPGTRAYRRSCSHHKKRHGRAIRQCENRIKFFTNMGCDKSPWPWDKAVGDTAKRIWACDMPVP
ncbi:hypothetical protein GOBAR_AA03133 [Gossypium barbadense]|uniref:Uncharacterized protein n=1 Tax=Gossypium barbadense TaxID=3634 RepID=A0A2P5YPD0_GOSBA|nr:hypothetical protein GOBAR_AA03133 [Gossypium barbadense]